VNAGLGRGWLLRHLPHQGAMSLLEEVTRWDESTLRARATSHRSPRNPLRRAGELPATAAIEYGAQAAAAHGSLASQAPSGAGMIASVRSVIFHVRRLDDIDGDLEIGAAQMGGAATGVLYRFEVSAAGRLLVEGRVTVAFSR